MQTPTDPLGKCFSLADKNDVAFDEIRVQGLDSGEGYVPL